MHRISILTLITHSLSKKFAKFSQLEYKKHSNIALPPHTPRVNAICRDPSSLGRKAPLNNPRIFMSISKLEKEFNKHHLHGTPNPFWVRPKKVCKSNWTGWLKPSMIKIFIFFFSKCTRVSLGHFFIVIFFQLPLCVGVYQPDLVAEPSEAWSVPASTHTIYLPYNFLGGKHYSLYQL